MVLQWWTSRVFREFFSGVFWELKSGLNIVNKTGLGNEHSQTKGNWSEFQSSNWFLMEFHDEPEPRKKPPYFPWNTGWLIRILIMVYYNPYITGYYFIPYTLNNQGPFFHCSPTWNGILIIFCGGFHNPKWIFFFTMDLSVTIWWDFLPQKISFGMVGQSDVLFFLGLYVFQFFFDQSTGEWFEYQVLHSIAHTVDGWNPAPVDR